MAQLEKTHFIINARVLDADANPVDQPFTLAVAGGMITAIEAEAERLRSAVLDFAASLRP